MIKDFIKSDYTNNDLSALIRDLESKLNLDAWCINEINLWTIVRNSLKSCITESRKNFNVQKSEQKTINKKISSYVINFLLMLINSFMGVIQFINIFFYNIHRFHKFPILLLGDGVSKSCVNGYWADKFLDPIRERFMVKNKLSLFLDINSFKKKNLYSNIFNINYFFHSSYLFSRIINLLPVKKIIDLNQSVVLDNELNKHNIKSTDFSLKNLSTQYYQIVFLSFFAKLIMRFFGVSRVYIVSYYNIFGYSFCCAAHALGIKVVEIQHGIQEGHPAYQFWPKLIKQNVLLPHFFWLWDKDSYNSFIRNNNPLFLSHHKAFVGGLPWSLRSKTFKSLEKINHSLFDSKLVHVLITMQPDEHEKNLWLKVIPLIKKYNNFRWWIRRHPAFSEECYELNEFDNPQFQYINFSDAFNIPIYTLLEHCKINITTYSSSAIDAELYSATTLFLSDLCYDFFPNIIKKKKGFYCETSEDLELKIKQIIKTLKY